MKRPKFFWMVHFKFPYRHQKIAILAGPVYFGSFKRKAEIEQWRKEFIAVLEEVAAEEGLGMEIIREKIISRPAERPWPPNIVKQKVGQTYAFLKKNS